MTSIDVWRMLAGIAFFLLAFNFMEDSLRSLAGRSFKLFLKKQTSSKVKAIAGGALVTGVLQSSSIVNLLILSLVGASVLGMESALAMMLGSNLGTTISNWMIATLGFTYNIEQAVLPVVAVMGIAMAFLKPGTKKFLWAKFLFSLAFLFVAIGFIKEGMGGFVEQTDLSVFNKYPAIVYLFVGMVLTGIVQSSSVTIALTLAALHSGIISLYFASAIALGAEIGTTFKLFLASARGLNTKKRVALGNFIINVVTVIVIFSLLKPVNNLVTETIGIKNKLLALVFIQSFANICSIIIFYPFIKQLGKFLMSKYRGGEEKSFYIHKVSLADTDMALDALENEAGQFFSHVVEYTLDAFDQGDALADPPEMRKEFANKTHQEKYDYIKEMHGEMHRFAMGLQNEKLDKLESNRLQQLISSIRNGMYAAKSIHDSADDIEQLGNSSNDVKYEYFLKARKRLVEFCLQVASLLKKERQPGRLDEMTKLYRSTTSAYSDEIDLLYQQRHTDNVNSVEISTMINFNRQLFTAFKSYIFGLKDYLLTEEEADQFDSLPGFIR